MLSRSSTRTFAFLSLLTATAMVHATHADYHQNAHVLQKRAQSYKGCYSSSSSDMKNLGSYTYQSTGYCGEQCTGENQAVMGLSAGDECWCGGNIPAESDKVDDSKCNSPCTGYGQDDCGGDGFWSVYTTGTGTAGTDTGSSSSEAPPTKSPSSTSAIATISTSTAAGHTVVVTISPSSSPTLATTSSAKPSGGGGGSSTAGVAAGVVVGVVAAAGLIGGLIFWRKKKAAREAEEDYARKTQVGDFMRGGGERKPPGSGYSGMSDQRLDPEAGRRNSVGSLADNQDYSRRILRVANPDNS